MGAKTDAFIKDIGLQMQKCAMSVANLDVYVKGADDVRNKMGQYLDIMNARHEHFFPGGHQTSEAELAIEKDPAFRDAADKHDALASRLQEAWGKRNQAKTELRGHLTTLDTKVKTFEAYIKTKEKAWFKSKKSVPAAKSFILATKEYKAKCDPLTK